MYITKPNAPVAGRIMLLPPKAVHVLIAKNFEYVILYRKKGFFWCE